MNNFNRFTEHIGFAVENGYTEVLQRIENEKISMVELQKKEDTSNSLILKYDKNLESLQAYFSYPFSTYTQLKNRIEYESTKPY